MGKDRFYYKTGENSWYSSEDQNFLYGGTSKFETVMWILAVIFLILFVFVPDWGAAIGEVVLHFLADITNIPVPE